MLAMHVLVPTYVRTSDLCTDVCLHHMRRRICTECLSIFRCRYRHIMGAYTRLGRADNGSAHTS